MCSLFQTIQQQQQQQQPQSTQENRKENFSSRNLFYKYFSFLFFCVWCAFQKKGKSLRKYDPICRINVKQTTRKSILNCRCTLALAFICNEDGDSFSIVFLFSNSFGLSNFSVDFIFSFFLLFIQWRIFLFTVAVFIFVFFFYFVAFFLFSIHWAFLL